MTAIAEYVATFDMAGDLSVRDMRAEARIRARIDLTQRGLTPVEGALPTITVDEREWAVVYRLPVHDPQDPALYEPQTMTETGQES